jgi:hypothetical protein
LKDIVIKEGDKVVWDSQGFHAGPQGVDGVEENRAGLLVKIGSGSYDFILTGD